MITKMPKLKKHSMVRKLMPDTFSNAFGTIISQIILSIVSYILKMVLH